MKRLSRLLAITLIGASVIFSSCEREDDNTNNGNTNNGNNGTDATVPDGWVDLGLPSGLLWAEQNLKSSGTFDKTGCYIQWGETWQTMTTVGSTQYYNWGDYYYGTSTYQNGTYVYTLYKYNDMTAFGTVDNLTTLQPSDDYATECLGNNVHIPTAAEWNELISNTTGVWWRDSDGKWGWKFTASNGNSIFLPANGYKSGYGNGLIYNGTKGYYWSSSLGSNGSCYAKSFNFSEDGSSLDRMERCYGLNIRPVRSR